MSTSSKSSPLPQQLPRNDASSDLERSAEAPPTTTSRHTSLDGSHSIVEEKGWEGDGERESGDENNVSGRIAEKSPPSKSTPSHSLTSDGSTTPEPSPLRVSLQPTSEEMGSQHTADTSSTAANSSHAQDTSPSLQSNTSSSRKVAFSTEEGVSTSSVSAQLGLLSPGSLPQQAGLSFQTPPSSSSYQLMSELPPTPFQDANFDLDSSSSESEHEEEKGHQHLSHHEDGNSFDSSYFRRLQKRVGPLISQEDIEVTSIHHDLDGVISRVDMEEELRDQPKLVDVDQRPSDLQPPMGHLHGTLDSANSLKVDDLLGLDSPFSSCNNNILLQSPLLKAYRSPQDGSLVNIQTPGSNLSAKPLLTSTVQGCQVSAATSQRQRGHVPSPTSDILLPYLPSHSGNQSGAMVTSSSVDSQRTWSSLMDKSTCKLQAILIRYGVNDCGLCFADSGSPFPVSPANNVTEPSAAKRSS